MELITDPLLIILDEPTSGLDSFNAVKIVKLLHRLSKTQNKTVISTIHQPSSESFQEFDRLLLMIDGYIVYQGKAKLARKYLSSIGYQCPPYVNPADYVMKLLQVEYPKSPEEEERIQKLLQNYQSSIK